MAIFRDFLLKEDGDFLLLETGDKIILEQSKTVPGTFPTAKFGGGWFVMPKFIEEPKDKRRDPFNLDTHRRKLKTRKFRKDIASEEVNF